MHKVLTTLALAVFLLPAVSFASFDTNLKYGNTGSFVSELQEFLSAHNYLNSPATGNFFSLTLAAVKQFQAANNLPSTGYFGPMSRAVANSLLTADLASSTVEATTNGDTSAPVPAVVSQTAPQPTPVVQAPVVQPAPVLGAVAPIQAPVTSCDDTPNFTVTPFTLDAYNNPTVTSLTIPLYDPASVASVNQQISAINAQIEQLTGGSYSGNPADYSGRVATLAYQIQSIQTNVHRTYLVFGVSVKSSCSGGRWLIDEPPTAGVTGKYDFPSDDYPVGTDEFVHAFNGIFYPNGAGVYPITFVARKGNEVGTDTIQITVTN